MGPASHRFSVDSLAVEVYPDRQALGSAAAGTVAGWLRQALTERDRVGAIFASAPSQDEFLASLVTEPNLDWSRVVAFHLDEYVGLPSDMPQSFAHFLRQRLFDRVHPGVVHYLDSLDDPERACQRYANLLASQPLAVACIGIGENGHLAFNDPHIADFADPFLVKPVEIDEVSRAQQVHDGCFLRIDLVPRRALTVTLPAILSAERIAIMVPGSTKARAIQAALQGPITTSCPASILRRHPHAVLFVDEPAVGLL
ncbi:MAG: glucosamine-6-phosphate deaminase [Chloroflexi bacterium]|nr:glucosamine-6-phosphate deaminase [Chloroflexota bacterium]